ncbi:hypothetical protein KSF73_10375 [Burkholderiaceae bacterium DAT-1]|nr:hypothetical protein [Burkholderiaceae bacterium DAT-1]
MTDTFHHEINILAISERAFNPSAPVSPHAALTGTRMAGYALKRSD